MVVRWAFKESRIGCIELASGLTNHNLLNILTGFAYLNESEMKIIWIKSHSKRREA